MNFQLFTFNFQLNYQERQDELGLNWDSFKYRNYDYAIGRFFNVDPLTEDYMDWAPYVFSGNRVIDARELEGLEPGSIHKSLQDAAINYGQYYNGRSIINGKEYGTRFYSVTKDGKTTYSYVEPNEGSKSGVFLPDTDTLPPDTQNEGVAHTHGNDEIEQFEGQEDEDNQASGPDIDYAKENGIPSFVITPNGSVIEIDPETGNTKVISTDVPSDPNSPTRKNNINPTLEPYIPENQNQNNKPKKGNNKPKKDNEENNE